MAIRMSVHGVDVETDTVAEAVDVIRGLALTVTVAAPVAPERTNERTNERTMRSPQRRAPAAAAAKRRETGPDPDALKTSIVTTLERYGVLKTSVLAKELQADVHAVAFALKRLTAAGVLRSEGKTAGKRWMLARAKPVPAKEEPHRGRLRAVGSGLEEGIE